LSNKQLLTKYLSIFTLSAFALAQPLFDLLSRSPEFFVARHSEPLDVVLLVLALLLPVPLVLCAIEALARLVSGKAGGLVHGMAVISLMTLVLLPLLKGVESLPDTVVLAVSVLGGVVFLLAYLRFSVLQQLVGFLGVSLLVFPMLFLFNSPVYSIVFKQKTELSESAKTDANTSIFMIVFDELPVSALLDENRLIDKNLYPNLAALADNSHWFRNATTVATSTALAVPAIMTGNYPKVFATPQAKNYPNSIFSILAGSYDMNVVESATRVCHPELCKESERHVTMKLGQRMFSLLLDLGVVYLHIVLPDDFATELPGVNQGWNNFWQPNNRKHRLYEDRFGQVELFIDSIQTSDNPSLNFIHITLPHVPYEYLPSGKRYSGGWQIPGLDMQREVWANDDWLISQGYQRFLLQVGAVDLLVGKLVSRLKEADIYDSSLIVVTSDHGVSFLPNTARRDLAPMSKLERDIMPVPLLIKAPGQKEAFISERNIETIDVLPTILDLLEIENTYAMDGVSALNPGTKERQSKTLFYEYKALKQHIAGPVIDSKYDTLKWKLSRFSPTVSETGSLFKVGYGRELVGQHAEDMVIAGSAPFKVEVDQALFSDVDPGGSFIPARVAGRVQGQKPGIPPRHLAISVNGVVQAVARTFTSRDGKSTEFSAMVPESSFRKGFNKIDVFLISSDEDAGLSLLPAQSNRSQASTTFAINRKGGPQGVVLESPDRKIPVEPGHLKGYLEYVNVRDGTVEFFGWALEVADETIPEAVLIFEDGESVYSGKTTIRRKGTLSGFQFVLPLGLFSDLGDSSVRLIAVSEKGIASELEYFKDYEWRK
jgi:hypothetical protein